MGKQDQCDVCMMCKWFNEQQTAIVNQHMGVCEALPPQVISVSATQVSSACPIVPGNKMACSLFAQIGEEDTN